jgi:type IV pilus assembly protein PilV
MRSQKRTSGGSVLLEALVGILIFSIGILALVAMQAESIRNTTEAKYRNDASYLANQIIGRMWADRV